MVYRGLRRLADKPQHRGPCVWGRGGEGREGSGGRVDGKDLNAARTGNVEKASAGVGGHRGAPDGEWRIGQRTQHAVRGIDAVAGDGAVHGVGYVEEIIDGGQPNRTV